METTSITEEKVTSKNLEHMIDVLEGGKEKAHNYELQKEIMEKIKDQNVGMISEMTLILISALPAKAILAISMMLKGIIKAKLIEEMSESFTKESIDQDFLKTLFK